MRRNDGQAPKPCELTPAAIAWRLAKYCGNGKRFFTKHEVAKDLGIFDLDAELEVARRVGYLVTRQASRTCTGAIVIRWSVQRRAQP